MSDVYGLFVSNEGKEVVKAQSFDLCFSADLNMLKVKQEKRSGRGEVLGFDHGLGYFPFIIAFLYDFNATIANGKTSIPHTGSNNSIGNWSGTLQTDGWMFVCHNPGAP